MLFLVAFHLLTHCLYSRHKASFLKSSLSVPATSTHAIPTAFVHLQYMVVGWICSLQEKYNFFLSLVQETQLVAESIRYFLLAKNVLQKGNQWSHHF